MTSAAQASSVVSARYAVALIESAQAAKVLDKVEADMRDLLAMVEDSSDLQLLIRSPLSGRENQKKAFFALADKAGFQKITKNFIGVLIENRRLQALPAILAAFQSEISKRRGEVCVHVETAQDLTPSQAKALQNSISKAIGSDVLLNLRVEPSIMGGMIVTVGSQMIDNSVRRKLERLKGAMSRGANENSVNVSEVG